MSANSSLNTRAFKVVRTYDGVYQSSVVEIMMLPALFVRYLLMDFLFLSASVTTASKLACVGLDRLEERYPSVLNITPEQVGRVAFIWCVAQLTTAH